SFFLKYRKLWARGDGSIFQREGQVAGLSEQDAVHQQARFRGWRLPSRLKPRFSPNSEPAAAPQRRPKRPQQLLRAPLPGQGSQFVGMGRGLLKYPNVKEMFTVAQKILGYDLCSDLLAFTSTGVSRTDVWQSCVSGAATDKPAKRQMSGVEARDGSAAAGGVDGEAAAGVDGGAAAGGVDAETMQKASELVPSGMLSVIGRPQDQYNYACLQAKEHCKSLGMENPVCSVANYRFPDGRVIAGHQQALDFLQENSRRLKFMRTKTLPVSGAFHTELMASATEPLREVLRQVEVSQPLYPKGINMHKHAFNYSVKLHHCQCSSFCPFKKYHVHSLATFLLDTPVVHPQPEKGPTSSSLMIPAQTSTPPPPCWRLSRTGALCPYQSSHGPIHLAHQDSLSFHQSIKP
uniref:Malonyl-CoA-acyl carrier protein transacylase, mitochondrial n=1 Tax=Oreochromis aureus TaxID=47969 RepID=A0AAZ1XR68_OREAU